MASLIMFCSAVNGYKTFVYNNSTVLLDNKEFFHDEIPDQLYDIDQKYDIDKVVLVGNTAVCKNMYKYFDRHTTIPLDFIKIEDK